MGVQGCVNGLYHWTQPLTWPLTAWRPHSNRGTPRLRTKTVLETFALPKIAAVSGSVCFDSPSAATQTFSSCRSLMVPPSRFQASTSAVLAIQLTQHIQALEDLSQEASFARRQPFLASGCCRFEKRSLNVQLPMAPQTLQERLCKVRAYVDVQHPCCPSWLGQIFDAFLHSVSQSTEWTLDVRTIMAATL